MALFFYDSHEIYTVPCFYKSDRIFSTVKEYENEYPEQAKNGLISLLISNYSEIQNVDDFAGERRIQLIAVCVEGIEDKLNMTDEDIIKETEKKQNLTLASGNRCEWMPLKRYYRRRESFNKENSELKHEIKKFVDRKDSYKKFNDEVNSRVLGQKNINQITYNIFMWLKGIAAGKPSKNNIMLAAPSGCGKTETYRVINDILERDIGCIPVLQFDMTQLTAEGFSGRNTDDFFKPLLERSTNGIAIVVLDELDKKIMPRYERFGTNVNSDIQSQILTFIEGTKYSDRLGRHNIDTNNTLFIGAGAFQELRSQRIETKKSRIGFLNEDENTESDRDIEFKDITIQDMMKAGAMKELMGRFTSVVNYHELSRDCVNTLVRRYADEYEKQLGCKISISADFSNVLYKEYKESSLGCRVLKSEIWNRLYDTGIKLELMSKSERKNISHINIGAKDTSLVYKADERQIEKCPA